MRADSIMTEEMAAVELGSSIMGCAQTMLRGGAGSVVAMASGDPVSIVTESDALRTGVANGKPLSVVPTRTIMSSPVKWIQPDSTAYVAAEKMCENRVKKLVVVDDSEMAGIVTTTDIAFHLSDMARGVDQVVELKNRRESDR